MFLGLVYVLCIVDFLSVAISAYALIFIFEYKRINCEIERYRKVSKIEEAEVIS